MEITRYDHAILSGNCKECLIIQSVEVEALLKRYVQVHNKRLKSAGTFSSLFRKTNFEEIYKEVNELYLDFEEKRVEVMVMEGDYSEYTKIQQNFYDTFVSYYSALFEAVELLQVIANKQNELSKGLGKDKLTLKENLALENKYKEKVQAYSQLGDKLNTSFQELKDEPSSDKETVNDKGDKPKMASVPKIAQLTEIKINPFERYPIFYMVLVSLCLFVYLALSLSRWVSAVFWILAVFAGFFTASVIYMRLSAKWRRVHYPLMVRYASVMGFVQGQYASLTTDEKMDIALLSLLQSVYPKISPEYIQSYYEGLLGKLPLFMEYEMVGIVLKRKLPDVATEDIEKMAKYFADKVKNEKFKKVWSVIADLIENKYGKEERLEYVFSIIKGKAT